MASSSPMRECVRACLRESGQTVVEWLAVIAGVVTLAGAATVAMPSVAPVVTGAMQTVICDVVSGSCAAPPLPAAPATPAPTAPTVPTAPANPPTTAPPADQDLCGSSYFNVPELWFTPACAAHDRCYGAHQGKAACDTAFLHDMLDICAKLPSSGGVNSNLTRASCRAAAHLYYKGVVVGGGPSYCHHAVCRDE